MKKKVLLFLMAAQVAFAVNGTYESTKYVFCDSKKSLDQWTQFDVDNDKASQRAYFGSKCFLLKEDISVSGIKTDWGKVSFFYGGYELWGYREGIHIK